ncbi:response regulator transcription factor [Thiomicrorhabdus sp. Kp2]|uniref:response regulator transcription factor n=1 Tax=Thiomicrorhabdus sp. Kp2 TaxID=1123518 RepID=UPI000402C535|nr:response regulator [Thiomicrorhabdus sp. Kp2]
MSDSVNVLLVDDDDVFLSLLKRTLEREGWRVFCALNSEQVFEKTKEHSFDYAILDLNLDGQSGLNLMQSLLAEQPKCEVLILTGYASVATAVEAMRLGAKDYLCKPATAQQIINIFSGEKVETKEPETEEFQPMSVKRLEWEHIQKVLLENDGNISLTAEALNMHRRTLQRKLQKRPVEK